MKLSLFALYSCFLHRLLYVYTYNNVLSSRICNSKKYDIYKIQQIRKPFSIRKLWGPLNIKHNFKIKKNYTNIKYTNKVVWFNQFVGIKISLKIGILKVK